MDDYFINTKEQYHISYLLLLEIYVNGAIFTQSLFWIWEEGKQANVDFTTLCGHHKAKKYLCANNIATETNLE